MARTNEGRLTRRVVLLGGAATASFAAGVELLGTRDGAVALLTSMPPLPPQSRAVIITDGIITAVSVLGDVAVTVATPVLQTVAMQTNGAAICIDLAVAKGVPDLTKLIIEVSDRGHAPDGSQTSYSRRIAIRSLLRGPIGSSDYVDGGPQRLIIVLNDPLFNQDRTWRTSIVRLRCLDGWLPGRLAETIDGERIQRKDTLAYPPFPVRPLTPPFQRMVPWEDFRFEVTGMHEWGRDGSMFARVEAWTHSNGSDGPVVGTSVMKRSVDTPVSGTPSGLPAPVYSMLLNAAGLPEGEAEIRYRVLPFIGPPWNSMERGEDFPTLGASKYVPFCNDLTNSWAPIYGIVSPTGVGLPGSNMRGLAFSIEAAIASGLFYADCTAVASAVRVFNTSPAAQLTASGMALRTRGHNDVAGGVAVLRGVAGSVSGSNFGAYTLRSPANSLTLFPPGATCFEIRSESGLPSEAVRLRGVNASGTTVSAKARLLPSRVLLRGIWIDGTGTFGAQNITIDGGSTTTSPTRTNASYLVMIDSVITQNPTAASNAPARTRFSFVWDVRLRLDGNNSVPPFAGIVASIGSSYAAIAPTRRIPFSALVGVKLNNVGVEDQKARSRLMLNVRIDYDVTSPTTIIALGATSPSVGGLGIGNVFVRALVDSPNPIMQIGADSTLMPIDNVIIRYFGSDQMAPARVNNGRSNLLYQDHGYVRIDKIGSVSFSAFRSYNTKGDTFPSSSSVNSGSTSWAAGKYYLQGSVVHDSIGAATATSTFFQAIAETPAAPGGYTASLGDTAVWQNLGQVFGRPSGEQPRRQGNLKFRYHVGCHGNVACVTYNGAAFPGTSSGFGIIWGADELVYADYSRFYSNPVLDDYRPMTTITADPKMAPLLNRVPVGSACLPFDLSGAPRLNDGTGAAGAYERA